jgi:hypothetical protein
VIATVALRSFGTGLFCVIDSIRPVGVVGV